MIIIFIRHSPEEKEEAAALKMK
jgi:hypothetical protein